MSESNALDKLLSEAELVVQKYNVKVKSSGASYAPSTKHSSDVVFKYYNESTSFHVSHSLHSKLPSQSNVGLNAMEDLSLNDVNFPEKFSISTIKEPLPNLQEEERLENGFDEVSTINHATVHNEDIYCGDDESDSQESTGSSMAEFRELCWILLSSASSALRDYSRLSKHMESTGGNGHLAIISSQDVQAAQNRVSEAAAKIQHFLVEVGVTQGRAADAEAECLQMCTLLNSLLQGTDSLLSATGLQHLAGTTLISPRRSSAQRLVETARSNLELMKEEFQRSQDLQQQQAERVHQLQQQVIDDEKKLQEATDKCSSLVLEKRDLQRQQEQQLQQLCLQLARAEEGLEQTTSELQAAVAARKEFEEEQLRVTASLREELAQCQQKLLSSTAATKELKAQFDHLREESAARLMEVGAECDRLQRELDTVVASSECAEKSHRAAMAAAREERDSANSAAALLQGELQALQLSHSKLQTLADDRLSMIDDVTREVLALREQLNDCKSINDAEVKNLHETLSKQGASLCECQQQLRKEKMVNMQQKTQLQLEMQRVSELKQHNEALLKQNDELNKVLADQLDRKVADDVKNILKSLKNQSNEFQHVCEKNCTLKYSNGENFNNTMEDKNNLASPTVKNKSNSEPVFTSSPDGRHDPPFSSRAKLSPVFDSSRSQLSTNQEFEVGSPLSSRASCLSRRFPQARHNTPSHPLDVTNYLADLQSIEESMEAFAGRGVAAKTPVRKFDDDKDEDVTQPLDLTGLSSSSLTQRLRSLRISPLSSRKGDRNIHDSKYSSSESLSTRPRSTASYRSRQLSSTSLQSLTASRKGDFPTISGVDSGLGSSASNDRDETGAELRKVRAEARKERLEAAKLRERCALLQVEVDSQKAALEDERTRHRFKTRLYRVKREEFGQFLGELEGNLDHYTLSSSPLRNSSVEDALTSGFHHSEPVSKAADGLKTTISDSGLALKNGRSVDLSGRVMDLRGRSVELTEADVSVNGVRLSTCRTDIEESVDSGRDPSILNGQKHNTCLDPGPSGK